MQDQHYWIAREVFWWYYSSRRTCRLVRSWFNQRSANHFHQVTSTKYLMPSCTIATLVRCAAIMKIIFSFRFWCYDLCQCWMSHWNIHEEINKIEAEQHLSRLTFRRLKKKGKTHWGLFSKSSNCFTHYLNEPVVEISAHIFFLWWTIKLTRWDLSWSRNLSHNRSYFTYAASL